MLILIIRRGARRRRRRRREATRRRRRRGGGVCEVCEFCLLRPGKKRADLLLLAKRSAMHDFRKVSVPGSDDE